MTRRTPAKMGGAGGGVAPFSLNTQKPSALPPQDAKILAEDAAKTARLMRWILQDVAAELLPKERVRWCLHRAIPGTLREIWRAVKTGKAHYKNFIVCGSGWHCPICANKISMRRREELVKGFTAAAGLGLTPVFVSFTLRHKKGEALAVTLKALLKAYSRLKSGRAWMEFVERFGLVGDIRALECTCGELHGWHPHFHVVLFVRSADVPAMQAWLQKHWVGALGASGRSAIREFAVVAKVGNEEIAGYLNKAGNGWQLEDEMTRGVTKNARAKGRTPFALLRDYAGGDKKAGALFREYAAAFKGKVQLRYSAGLRKLLGLGKDLTDEEIAKQAETESELCTAIQDYEWVWVEQFRARGNLLEVASKHGWEGVRSFLDVLGARAAVGERGAKPKGERKPSKPKPLGVGNNKAEDAACPFCGAPVVGGHICEGCRETNRMKKTTPRPAVGAE